MAIGKIGLKGLMCLSLIHLTACSDSGSGGNTALVDPGASCSPSVASGLRFQSVPGTSGIPHATLTLQDPLCETYSVATVNNCSNFLADVTPESVAVDPSLGFINSTSGSEVEICFRKGAETPALSNAIVAIYQTLTATIDLEIERTPTEIPDLFRWYKADSFLPFTDATTIGFTGASEWLDLSTGATPYNGYAFTNRNPLWNASLFRQPSVRFCGTAGGCGEGVTANSHLRTASSFAEYAGSDLTMFVVAARATNQRQYFLSNQSNGNNTGLFLGFTSDTNFRFGLNGPGGTPILNVTVAGYSGTPVMEYWTVRLNTGSHPTDPGVIIYRNGVEVARNASLLQLPATATTIPYIGTQRSDHNNAQFHLGEWIYFKRALSSAELTSMHTYLSGRHL